MNFVQYPTEVVMLVVYHYYRFKLRQARQGMAGKKWHTDATYIKIEGRWCYLYRAIDKQGNL